MHKDTKKTPHRHYGTAAETFTPETFNTGAWVWKFQTWRPEVSAGEVSGAEQTEPSITALHCITWLIIGSLAIGNCFPQPSTDTIYGTEQSQVAHKTVHLLLLWLHKKHTHTQRATLGAFLYAHNSKEVFYKEKSS